MNKSTAEKIARSDNITWGEIQQTLIRARQAGACDERRSRVNKTFSKGISFNILWGMAQEKDPDLAVCGATYSDWVGAKHVLVDFGEFWEGWTPEPAPKRLEQGPLAHQEPVSIDKRWLEQKDA